MTDIKPHDLPVSTRLLKMEAAIDAMQKDTEMHKIIIDDNFASVYKSIKNICETVLSKKHRKSI